MQNDFIRTRLTLINRLAKDTKSAHEEDWARFFDLYYPAMVKFAELHGGGEASEDIAQDALVKIVNAFRAGKYSRRPGISFRAYLMTILRNELSLAYWREQARGAGRKVRSTKRRRQYLRRPVRGWMSNGGLRVIGRRWSMFSDGWSSPSARSRSIAQSSSKDGPSPRSLPSFGFPATR